MTNSERDVVASLGQMIAQRVGEKRYDLWFAKNAKLTWSDDELVVGVPNRFFQEWLQSTFAEHVREAASSLSGRAIQVRFAIDPELFQAARRAQAEAGALGAPVQAAEQLAPNENKSENKNRQEARPTQKPQRRWHRLGDFVAGPCNRVAYASAVNLIEAPGDGPNPLVLHGPVGTGKSHLLEGIYAGLRKQHPDWRVCYATSEDFTNRFVQAMRLGKLAGFRKHFRDCDALLLDDLHFLARKRATQEEFLHTLDALLAANRPLVVACDCHPRLAGELAPEIVDRLLGGAVWGLAPPDLQCRVEILRAKAAGGEPHFPDSVLRYLAEQLRGNVRELEGALHSVRHLSRVSGKSIDLNLVREAIGDLLRHSVRLVQLGDVDRAVCQVLQLKDGSLQSRNRVWSVSHPRMLAMFVARKHTGASYSEIGRHFGGRNHTTAVAAEKKVRQWSKQNGELALGSRRLPVKDVIELVERILAR